MEVVPPRLRLDAFAPSHLVGVVVPALLSVPKPRSLRKKGEKGSAAEKDTLEKVKKKNPSDQRPRLGCDSRPALLINPTETPGRRCRRSRRRSCQGMNCFHKVLCHGTRLVEIFPEPAAAAPLARISAWVRSGEFNQAGNIRLNAEALAESAATVLALQVTSGVACGLRRSA